MFGAGRRPRVGLLSIGEEETKGNLLTRESFQLLKRLPLNFVGNVEGRDLFNGHVDVIVADGFVGNVALKISEGVANLVRTVLKESLKATITSQVGAMLSRSAFSDFKKRIDHTEYGGAPLLGLKGVCIITHGSSNANAIKNAVRVAAEFSERNINKSIEQGLAALRPAPAPVEVGTGSLSFSRNQDDDRINKRAPHRHIRRRHDKDKDRIHFSRPGIAGRRHGQGSRREVSHRAADV